MALQETQQSGKPPEILPTLRQRYAESLKLIEEELFSAPKTPEQNLARQQWEHLQSKQGYREEKEKIMQLMRYAGEKIFVAMGRRLQGQAATLENAQREINALDAYIQKMRIMGQTIKMIESPYASRDRVVASEDVLETSEAIRLRKFAEFLNSLDVEELINMVTEDQTYITMLLQESNPQQAEHFGPRKLDPSDANKDYRHHLEHLRRFILGKPEKDESGGEKKEKSQNRLLAETVLWLELVRRLDAVQRRDLVKLFIKSGPLKEAEDFISACCMAGVMTTMEVQDMHFENLTKDEKFWRDLQQTVDEKKVIQDQMKQAVDRVENFYTDNFVNQYVTFDNIVMGRVAEIGVLTAGLNAILDIADRWRRRGERGEKGAEALMRGVGDALKNRNFWIGVGEIAVSTDYVYPWIRSAISAPSREAKETLVHHEEKKFLQDAVLNHPGLGGYFLNHYEGYLSLARQHELGEDLPKDMKASFDLLPDDVELTEQEAGQFGYRNKNEARAAMLRMFGICGKTLKKENLEQLREFFDREIYEQTS